MPIRKMHRAPGGGRLDADTVRFITFGLVTGDAEVRRGGGVRRAQELQAEVKAWCRWSSAVVCLVPAPALLLLPFNEAAGLLSLTLTIHLMV